MTKSKPTGAPGQHDQKSSQQDQAAIPPSTEQSEFDVAASIKKSLERQTTEAQVGDGKKSDP